MAPKDSAIVMQAEAPYRTAVVDVLLRMNFSSDE
jgi:hypothetical protein